MKKAFTLIELLVYIAIMGFIIVVAGRAFSDSTGMRLRTQSMTRATEEANKMAALLKEDISQMGAKSIFKLGTGTNPDEFKAAKKVYIDPDNSNPASKDSSSYKLTPDDNSDKFHKIEFQKVHYAADGKTCRAVLKITWEVEANTLYRKCELVSGQDDCANAIDASECPSKVAMIADVRTFTLLPSKHASQTGFPFGGSMPLNSPAPTFKLLDRGNSGEDYIELSSIAQPSATNYNTATIEGFVKNESSGKKLNQLFVAAGDEPSISYTDCKKFNFKKDTVYAIQFKMPIHKNGSDYDDMALFRPGDDHIAVGLRKFDASGDYSKVGTDFMIWAPQTENSDNQNHYMEFSVPANANNTCVVFEFAFYSPSASNGTLRIKDFEIKLKNDKGYIFEENYEPPTADKKNVKAFKLVLEIDRRGETGRAEIVISTPNNGLVPN